MKWKNILFRPSFFFWNRRRDGMAERRGKTFHPFSLFNGGEKVSEKNVIASIERNDSIGATVTIYIKTKWNETGVKLHIGSTILPGGVRSIVFFSSLFRHHLFTFFLPLIVKRNFTTPFVKFLHFLMFSFREYISRRKLVPLWENERVILWRYFDFYLSAR